MMVYSFTLSFKCIFYFLFCLSGDELLCVEFPIKFYTHIFNCDFVLNYLFFFVLCPCARIHDFSGHVRLMNCYFSSPREKDILNINRFIIGLLMCV